MKTIIFFTLFAAIIATLPGCNKNNNNNQQPNTPGKQRFTIITDGITREYYVHVPAAYNPEITIPVVFMLHGSGGNGEKFYNISGWKEVGEAETILTVFPSSLQYPCVLDDGEKKRNAEKWNSYGLELCDGSSKADDVKFLSQVIDDVKQKFSVDEKRVYMVGFSNGGEMTSKTAIELSDKLAAVVSASGALPPDTVFTPLRKLPVLLQLGNSDEKVMTKLGATQPLPMDIGQLFSQFPLMSGIANSYVSSFELDGNFTTGGNPNQFVFADYKALSMQHNNSFRFVLIKGLGHSYPNGKNHPLKGAEVHWAWMKDFRLP